MMPELADLDLIDQLVQFSVVKARLEARRMGRHPVGLGPRWRVEAQSPPQGIVDDGLERSPAPGRFLLEPLRDFRIKGQGGSHEASYIIAT